MKENNRDIAARVREMRQICEYTTQQMADFLSISLKEYEGYESGDHDISISALYEISRILRVDLTDLLTGKSPNLNEYCVVRDGQGVEIERYAGYKFKSLASNFKNRKIEPLLVTIEPGDKDKVSLVTHPGQEYNMVLEGQVQVILGGNIIDLEKGDSIYFDPTIPHGQIARGDSSATFLTVILHEA